MPGKFINCDCFDDEIGMSSLEDKSINFIVSDLPYGETSNYWDIPIDFDILWREYKRIIADDGTIALCAKGKFMFNLYNSNPRMYRYEWIWDKRKGANFAHANKMPLNVHEYIVIFYKKQGTYNPQMEEGKSYTQYRKENSASGIADSMNRSHVTECDGQRYPKSIIRVPGIAQRFIIHPTQKPVALFDYLIKTYTNEGDSVLDNCAGVATTAIACMRNNRNYICYEKNQEFYEKGVKRINEEKNSVNGSRKKDRGLLDYVTS